MELLMTVIVKGDREINKLREKVAKESIELSKLSSVDKDLRANFALSIKQDRLRANLMSAQIQKQKIDVSVIRSRISEHKRLEGINNLRIRNLAKARRVQEMVRKEQNRAFTQYQTNINRQIKMRVRRDQLAEKEKNRFRMEYLSLLFFGMQMSRMFSGVAESGTAAFTKIMESSGNFGTAVQQLAVHWEYLKFVIGSVINRYLEPLMPIIIRVINAIARWIEKHPKLTSDLVLLGTVLGSAIMLLALFQLTIFNGAIPAIKNMIIWLEKTKILEAVGLAFKWMGNMAYAALTLITKHPIVAFIVALVALVTWLGVKWEWNFKAMAANMLYWFAYAFGWAWKWLRKIGTGIVGAFDIAFATVREVFAKLLNWIFDKFNEFLEWVAVKAEAIGADWIAGKARAAKIEFRFEEGGRVERAIERFQQIQESINKSFEDSMKGWTDVLDEWRDILEKEKELKGESQPGTPTPLPTPGGAGAFPSYPQNVTNINIETMNVNDYDDLKRELNKYSPTPS